MKKIFFALLLLNFISEPSFGQAKNVKSQIGKPQKTGEISEMFGVVGADQEGYYVLRGKSTGFSLLIVPINVKVKLNLDYYDREMNFVRSLEIEDIRADVGLKKSKCYEFMDQDEDGNLFLFYSEKKGDNILLWKSKFNKKKFSFEPPSLISELYNGRQKSFYLLESDDRTKKAIVSLFNSESSGQSRINIDYLDKYSNKSSNMEEIINFPIEEIGEFQNSGKFGNRKLDRSSVSESRLANNGDLILMAKTQKEGGVFKASIYDYHLISISGNSNKVKYQKLDFQGKIPLTGTLTNPDKISNQLRFTGFYSGDKIQSIEGVYQFDFNTDDLKITRKKFCEFDRDQKEDFLVSEQAKGEKLNRSERRIKKKIFENKDVRIKSFFIREQISFEDNSITIVAEEYFEYTTQTRMGNSVTFTTYFNFMDLVYIHINKRGEIEWVKNLKKNQVSSSKIGLGVYVFNHDNYIYSLYNDRNSKNLVLSSIDKKGDYEFKNISSLKKKSKFGKYQMELPNLRFLNDAELVGFAGRKDKSRFFKLKF
mgnify:CR=1 FL=1|tara:strand:- start:17540 stop:19153 length:1614 start_codon:yes stop_codon:yes gene_type:complete